MGRATAFSVTPPNPSNPPARSGEAISAVICFLPNYKVIVCKQYVIAIQNQMRICVSITALEVLFESRL